MHFSRFGLIRSFLVMLVLTAAFFALPGLVSAHPLTVEISASETELPQVQNVMLSLRVTNVTDEEVHNIELSCPYFDTEVLATLIPGEVYERNYMISPTQTTEYLFTAKTPGADGQSVTNTSNPLTIELPNATLTLDAQVSKDLLDAPGVVRFSVALTNQTGGAISNIVITEPTLGEFYTYDELNVGTATFGKSAQVDKSGTYIFTATVQTANGPLQVQSQPVSVSVLAPVEEQTPTPAPTQTQGAQVTDPPATSAPATQQPGSTDAVPTQPVVQPTEPPISSFSLIKLLITAAIVLVILIVICVVALVVVSIRERGMRRRTPEKAGRAIYNEERDVDEGATRYAAPLDEPATMLAKPKNGDLPILDFSDISAPADEDGGDAPHTLGTPAPAPVEWPEPEKTPDAPRPVGPRSARHMKKK